MMAIVNLASSQKGPRRRGLTLPTLLFVFASLLGVALFLTLAGYQHQRTGPKVTKARLAQIDVGLAAFKRHTGRYPTTTEGLHALISAPADAAGWNGPYLNDDLLKQPDLRDEWGSPLRYERSSATTYTVQAAGVDEQFGTADDLFSPDSSGPSTPSAATGPQYSQ